MSSPHAPNLPLDDPAVTELRMHFENLQRTARDMADQAVRLVVRKAPQRYWESRMTESSQKHLNAVFFAAYAQEIRKRLGQLDRLDEKLARICPDWPRHTAAELEAPPAYRYITRGP